MGGPSSPADPAPVPARPSRWRYWVLGCLGAVLLCMLLVCGGFIGLGYWGVSKVKEHAGYVENIAGEGEVAKLYEEARAAAPFETARPPALTNDRMQKYLDVRRELRPGFETSRDLLHRVWGGEEGGFDATEIPAALKAWSALKLQHAKLLARYRMSPEEYQHISALAFHEVGPVELPGELKELGERGTTVSVAQTEADIVRAHASELKWSDGWLMEEMLLCTSFGQYQQEALGGMDGTKGGESGTAEPAAGRKAGAGRRSTPAAALREQGAAAADPVLLRWKFKTGARRAYTCTLQMKGAQEDVKMDVQVALRVTEQVAGAGEIGSIAETVETVKVDSKGLFGDLTYDSQGNSSAETREALIVAPFAAMLGKTVTASLNALGEVSAVSGEAAVKHAQSEALGGLPQMVESPGLRVTVPFPRDPVKPRGSWTHKREGKTVFGELTGVSTYFFLGMVKHRGHDCAKIKVVTAYEGEAKRMFEALEETVDELGRIAGDEEAKMEEIKRRWAGEAAGDTKAGGAAAGEEGPRGDFPSQGMIYFDVEGGYLVESVQQSLDRQSRMIITRTLVP